MFNIKLEEKSYKTSLKALPVKIQQSKNRQGAVRVKIIKFIFRNMAPSFWYLFKY